MISLKLIPVMSKERHLVPLSYYVRWLDLEIIDLFLFKD